MSLAVADQTKGANLPGPAGHRDQRPCAAAATGTPGAVSGAAEVIEAKPVTVPRPTTGSGDHDRFAHYIRKADSARAYVEGVAVTALCGKVWVPSRDPERYPVCPTCVEIKKRLLNRSNN